MSRFALYYPWIYLRSGLERTILEHVRRSRHEWIVYTHRFEPAATYPGFAELDVRELSPRVSVRRSLGPLLHAAATIAAVRLPHDGAPALLVHSEGLGDLVALRERRPLACYCHTPLKILHDPLTRAALAQQRPGAAQLSQAIGVPFRAVDRAMWRRYRHVLVNSEETGRRVARAGLTDRAEVLHPGVDLALFGTAGDDGVLRAPTLLVAGRIMWQKNIELALDALRLLVVEGGQRELRLVVAGALDAKSVPYLAMLRQRAAGLPVEFVLDPSDDHLARLYAAAAVVVCTPRNEDWGMVALEAMAAGTPVVGVDAGGLRESVLPGRTGWLVPPHPDDVARAIRAALGDPAALIPMRSAARRRAARYGWPAFAARIDTVMEHVAAGEPAR